MTFSEAAAECIRLADARRAYWDDALPRDHPDYPIVRSGERRTPPPPEDGQLRAFLAGLSPELVYKLILTMYLGRRDFGPAALGDEYAEVKRAAPEPQIAASR